MAKLNLSTRVMFKTNLTLKNGKAYMEMQAKKQYFIRALLFIILSKIGL